jgi:CDP-paratose 2-epimerase
MMQAHEPQVGVHEWFPPGDREHVERVLTDLAVLRIRRIRTEIAYADFCAPGGRAWYEWLLPRLCAEVDVVPCFVHTRVSPCSPTPALSASIPPRETNWYADFVDEVIECAGASFEWLELWTAPSELRKWDVELDPEWWVFAQMISSAAYRAKQRGKRVVLGSTSPFDPHWVRLIGERNVMRSVDAVGIHGPFVTHETSFAGFGGLVAKVRDVLSRYESSAEVWITGTGYSTQHHDERRQLSAFVDALDAPVQRMYWYAMRDDAAKLEDPVEGETSVAPAEQHFGLTCADGTKKLIYRLWEAGGLDALRETLRWGERTRQRQRQRPSLITGGAGFIGTNLAHRLLESGGSVLIMDDLSRPQAERNMQWLRSVHGSNVELLIADVRDVDEVERAVGRASLVFHLAGRSISERRVEAPSLDFDVNVRGTLNVLEALRKQKYAPPLVYASTSDVYGALDDVELLRCDTRVVPACHAARTFGFGEDRALDWNSPYVCSKGAADQYVLDYARTFGLAATVFRLGSVYGPHQLGTEANSWVASFLRSALEGQPITVDGDGTQVRDHLHVDDVVDAFVLAQEHMSVLEGQACNLGGGIDNACSVLELLEIIGALHGELDLRFAPRRTDGPRYYVSNAQKFRALTGFSPRVPIEEGVCRLYRFLRAGLWAAPSPVPKAWVAP